jgi:hypothetical protein
MGVSTVWRMATAIFGRRAGTEEPPHEVLARQSGIEIRQYRARLAAQTTVPGTETEARYEGFRRLAGYIFGANQGNATIAMTAPVAQSAESIAMTMPVAQAPARDGAWVIRFFMPASHNLASLPRPNDPLISLVEVPPETYAVLRFAGRPTPARLARAAASLSAALQSGPWRALGAPTAWFYDPPWTLPPFRRNEVAVPVARATAAAG